MLNCPASQLGLSAIVTTVRIAFSSAICSCFYKLIKDRPVSSTTNSRSAVGEVLSSMAKSQLSGFDWPPTQSITEELEQSSENDPTLIPTGESLESEQLSGSEEVQSTEEPVFDREAAYRALEEAEQYLESVKQQLKEVGTVKSLQELDNQWKNQKNALASVLVDRELNVQLEMSRGYIDSELQRTIDRERESLAKLNHVLERELDPALERSLTAVPESFMGNENLQHKIHKEASSVYRNLRKVYDAIRKLPEYEEFTKSVDGFRDRLPVFKENDYAGRRANVLVSFFDVGRELQMCRQSQVAVPKAPSLDSIQKVPLDEGGDEELVGRLINEWTLRQREIEEMISKQDELGLRSSVLIEEVAQMRDLLGIANSDWQPPQFSEIESCRTQINDLRERIGQNCKEFLDDLAKVDVKTSPALYEIKLQLEDFLREQLLRVPLESQGSVAPQGDKTSEESMIQEAVYSLMHEFSPGKYNQLSETHQRRALELAKSEFEENLFCGGNGGQLLLGHWSPVPDIVSEGYEKFVVANDVLFLLKAGSFGRVEASVDSLLFMARTSDKVTADLADKILTQAAGGLALMLSRELEGGDVVVNSSVAREFVEKHDLRFKEKLLNAINGYRNGMMNRVSKLLESDPVEAAELWRSSGLEPNEYVDLARSPLNDWFAKEQSFDAYLNVLSYYNGLTEFRDDMARWVDQVAEKVIAILKDDLSVLDMAMRLLDNLMVPYGSSLEPELRILIDQSLNKQRESQIDSLVESNPLQALLLLQSKGPGWETDPRLESLAGKALEFFKKNATDPILIRRFIELARGVKPLLAVVEPLMELLELAN